MVTLNNMRTASPVAGVHLRYVFPTYSGAPAPRVGASGVVGSCKTVVKNNQSQVFTPSSKLAGVSIKFKRFVHWSNIVVAVHIIACWLVVKKQRALITTNWVRASQLETIVIVTVTITIRQQQQKQKHS